MTALFGLRGAALHSILANYRVVNFLFRLPDAVLHIYVVYLCAPVSVLVNRLQAAPEEDLRPTLTGKPLSEEVQEVLEERDALYREVAHIIIDATNEPSQVISEIRSALAQTINC